MIGRESRPALLLLLLLLAVAAAVGGVPLTPRAWGVQLGLAAPLLCAAAAVMPAMLGGGGGIDVSIGPMIGFVNAILVGVVAVRFGLGMPWVLVPAALLLGAILGAINGALATVVRVQPIIATLGTYLVLSGITLTLLPAPVGGAPAWLRGLASGWAALPLAALAAAWAGVVRTPFHAHLMATGSDTRAAFSAGVPVGRARFLSYVLGGAFAGLAGLMETALLGSADPTIGPPLTLVAISAAALGGVGLAGGQGGLVAALLGGADIFLLQATLTAFNVSPFVLQTAYGVILVASVCLNAVLRRGRAA